MHWKKELLKKSRLYVIADKKVFGTRFPLDIAAKTKGIHPLIIQLRDKESKKEAVLEAAWVWRKLCARQKNLFILNDYIDIARIVDSDGIHLGQDDLPLPIARRLLDKDKIIGVSCHNLNQAIKAQREGADYLSIGPIFSTPTKPEYKAVGLDLIKEVKKKIRIPFFAIGGINQKNLAKVLASGAERIAVCRAAKDLPRLFQKLK